MSMNTTSRRKIAPTLSGLAGALLSLALISPVCAKESSELFEASAREVKLGYALSDAISDANFMCTQNMKNGSWRSSVIGLRVWKGFNATGNGLVTYASFWYKCTRH